MFSGSLVAIVTPMRADGALDLDAWAHLLELHATHGTSGIVVGGTTGESATLSDAELHALTVRACELSRGRMAVIAGAGTSSTAGTVARVSWLRELPIDALLLVTPAYNRPAQEGLFRHFSAAAHAAAGKPLLLYNVPSRTAVDMQPATVARLSHIGGIVGVKEAVMRPRARRSRPAPAGSSRSPRTLPPGRCPRWWPQRWPGSSSARRRSMSRWRPCIGTCFSRRIRSR